MTTTTEDTCPTCLTKERHPKPNFCSNAWHDANDFVRFVRGDMYGLWQEGDVAEDLGWESDHFDAPRLRLLKLVRTGETIALYDPRTRKLIESC